MHSQLKNNNNNNYYYYKGNNTSQKCFLDNNDTSQFYFRVIITKPLTFAGCIGYILLLVYY